MQKRARTWLHPQQGNGVIPGLCAPSYLNTELLGSKQEGEHLFSSLEGISQAKDAAPGNGEQLKVGNRNPTRPFPHV